MHTHLHLHIYTNVHIHIYIYIYIYWRCPVDIHRLMSKETASQEIAQCRASCRKERHQFLSQILCRSALANLTMNAGLPTGAQPRPVNIHLLRKLCLSVCLEFGSTVGLVQRCSTPPSLLCRSMQSARRAQCVESELPAARQSILKVSNSRPNRS